MDTSTDPATEILVAQFALTGGISLLHEFLEVGVIDVAQLPEDYPEFFDRYEPVVILVQGKKCLANGVKVVPEFVSKEFLYLGYSFYR